jgi:hypothetical protein
MIDNATNSSEIEGDRVHGPPDPDLRLAPRRSLAVQ